MSEMFKNYPQPDDYKPNNYPHCRCFKPIEIICGEATVHTFEVPFDVETETTLCEVIYKLGLEPVIIKNNIDSLDVEPNEDGGSFVICKLSPEETLLFKNTYLASNVQVKFYMTNGAISYSDKYKIKVQDALDVRRPDRPEPSTPGTIAGLPGYGYTED